MSGENRYVPPIGVHANVWNAASTGVNTTSTNNVNTYNSPFITAFGTVNGATTITVMVSQNGTTFYKSQSTQVLGGSGDFCINLTCAAQYVALQSTADVTATATIVAKG